MGYNNNAISPQNKKNWYNYRISTVEENDFGKQNTLCRLIRAMLNLGRLLREQSIPIQLDCIIIIINHLIYISRKPYF